MTRVDCLRAAAWNVNRAAIMSAMGAESIADDLEADARTWRARGKAIPRRNVDVASKRAARRWDKRCCARARSAARVLGAIGRVYVIGSRA